MSESSRRLSAQIANADRWSRVPFAERGAQTQAARDGRWQRYLDAVPASVTDPAERAQLAAQARRADMLRAAAKSAKVRRARRAAADGAA